MNTNGSSTKGSNTNGLIPALSGELAALKLPLGSSERIQFNSIQCFSQAMHGHSFGRHCVFRQECVPLPVRVLVLLVP